HYRPRLLVLSLHFLLGKLEPPGDLVDDVGVEEVRLEPVGQHPADARPSRSELPPDRDDRHGLIVRANATARIGRTIEVQRHRKRPLVRTIRVSPGYSR